MIEEIRVKNFKCFRELDISLSDMTVLAGSNAAGKSTVVQAMLLFFATMQENGNLIDAGRALGVAVGNPQVLVAQDPIELTDTDFSIGITRNGEQADIRYRIDKLAPLKLLFERSGMEVGHSVFYLNAERKGPRISYPAGIDDTILSDGANAAFLIDRADMQQRRVSPLLSVTEPASKFSIHVEDWMSIILGDVNLSVTTDLIKASTDIRYGNSLVDQNVLPTMTGFGISYVLSVVTAGLWCSSLKNAVLIVENPEAHLHPGAQSRMGKFLQLVASAGVQVIIETHSEHVIDGARIQAAVMGLTDRISIKFLSKNDKEILVDNIKVNENGELEKWPDGFFDEKSQDLRELFQIRRANAGR